MPDDIEIQVVPTKVYPLPKAFVDANEKYEGRTRLVKQADGVAITTSVASSSRIQMDPIRPLNSPSTVRQGSNIDRTLFRFGIHGLVRCA
jgi:hypothetical protein